MQTKFIIGNWKMHTTSAEAKRLTEAITNGAGTLDSVAVALCPPFPYLSLVGEIINGSRIALGAQNLYPENSGTFTGEVSPIMLLDMGCKYVILGHSERRLKLHESDQFINHKVLAAVAAGLDVILCIGESQEQRTDEKAESVLDRQLAQGLANFPEDALKHLTIAYEPLWAIGGHGHHATPEQAMQSHDDIRRRFGTLFGDKAAKGLVILYGGSVKPDNAAALLGQRGVDGALIGGASLHADQFLAVIHAATNAPAV